MQQALGVPFESCEDVLFNDSAVVFPTEADENPQPQTISTALKYGWAWKIPLTSRFGNGYVYSSKYVDDDDAEMEFREHLGLVDSDVEARRLKFPVGRVREHWFKNCLAVGLSQGFIEPLEATALDMVQETVFRFVEAANNGDMTDRYRDEFNAYVSKRFDAVRDYIVCHYRINTRSDTDYWRDAGTNEKISQSLREILTAWIQGKNITDELERQNLDAYFPSHVVELPAGGQRHLSDRRAGAARQRACQQIQFAEHRRVFERLRAKLQAAPGAAPASSRGQGCVAASRQAGPKRSCSFCDLKFNEQR